MTHPITPSTLDAAFSEGRWGDVRRIPTPNGSATQMLGPQWGATQKVPNPDPVNHPPHYKSAGGLEVFDVIEAFAADDAHKSHVLKYVLRAGAKGSYIEDMRKARAWIDRAIQYHEEQAAA